MNFRGYSDRHYVIDVGVLEVILPSVASVGEALYCIIVLTLLHLEKPKLYAIVYTFGLS